MIPTTTSSPTITFNGFSGDFEAHITVRADDPADVAALEAHAGARGVKFTHIVLERGRTPSQPMLTLRGHGALEEVRGTVEEAARALREDGFDVVRTKIEATPWAEGVPGTDEEAVALGGRYYFEHHVKLLLAPGADTAALADVASRRAAHLSRNARRVRADGRAERFVTQRCRLVGGRTAQERLEALVTALRTRCDEIVSVEREFVVHDSDESLDAGWIDEEGTGR
ncbi:MULTISPECIES: hypothetical protein [Streptomyces]|uniref:hypothetical protein n=1 Tax=Streptomyces TaxID=1883 RepID=UPI001F61DA46|nr:MULTISPECIES: hypothetical protein [Streptomyces]